MVLQIPHGEHVQGVRWDLGAKPPGYKGFWLIQQCLWISRNDILLFAGVKERGAVTL